MDQTTEIWALVPACPEYEVSSLGRVRHFKRTGCKYLSPSYTKRGYAVVTIKGKACYIHHLVAEAFIGPRPNGKVIDHIDGNTRNNDAGNLQYVTQQVNVCKGRGRPVMAFLPDGTPYARYSSSSEAGRRLGASRQNIFNCASGRYATIAGFAWRFCT